MRVRIAVIFIGAALAFYGAKELWLAAKASSDPASLTCAELAANGPGDNLHVTLTEFLVPIEQQFVFENATGKPGAPYETVYVPLVPVGGEWYQAISKMVDKEGNIVGEVPAPKDIRVIAKLKTVRSDDALNHELSRRRMQGMVINDIESLKSDHKRLLREAYPEIDIDACWILEVDRKPKGVVTIAVFLGMGGLIILLAFVLPLGCRAASTLDSSGKLKSPPAA